MIPTQARTEAPVVEIEFYGAVVDIDPDPVMPELSSAEQVSTYASRIRNGERISDVEMSALNGLTRRITMFSREYDGDRRYMYSGPDGTRINAPDAELVLGLYSPFNEEALVDLRLAQHSFAGKTDEFDPSIPMVIKPGEPQQMVVGQIDELRYLAAQPLGITNPDRLSLHELARTIQWRLSLTGQNADEQLGDLVETPFPDYEQPLPETELAVEPGEAEADAALAADTDNQPSAHLIPPRAQPHPVSLRTSNDRNGDRQPTKRYSGSVRPHVAHPERRGRVRKALLLASAAILSLVINPTPSAEVASNDASSVQGIKLPDDPGHISPPREMPPAAEQPPVLNQEFFDNLQPKGYEGETYEWGALANEVGPSQANAELQKMIQAARDKGVLVQVWHDEKRKLWGISYIAVKLDSGKYAVYSETPNKLAILQWFADSQSARRPKQGG